MFKDAESCNNHLKASIGIINSKFRLLIGGLETKLESGWAHRGLSSICNVSFQKKKRGSKYRMRLRFLKAGVHCIFWILVSVFEVLFIKTKTLILGIKC